MRLIKYIVLVTCSFWVVSSKAQTSQPAPGSKLNQLDGRGKRTGVWLNNQSAKMGEEGFSEFGNYDQGNKTGPWYKLDGAGDLLAIENFRNNILDGEVKYFDKGQITCIGYYRGLNPAHEYDTIAVIDPENGNEVVRRIPTERGTVRHGTWRFYDPESGRLVREEDYQVDELIFQKDFAMSKADSLYYQKRNAKLPHSKDRGYKPPVAKQVSYSSGN